MEKEKAVWFLTSFGVNATLYTAYSLRNYIVKYIILNNSYSMLFFKATRLHAFLKVRLRNQNLQWMADLRCSSISIFVILFYLTSPISLYVGAPQQLNQWMWAWKPAHVEACAVETGHVPKSPACQKELLTATHLAFARGQEPASLNPQSVVLVDSEIVIPNSAWLLTAII